MRGLLYLILSNLFILDSWKAHFFKKELISEISLWSLLGDCKKGFLIFTVKPL